MPDDDYDVLVVRCSNLRLEPIDLNKTYKGFTLIEDDDDFTADNPRINFARCIKQVRQRSYPNTVDTGNIIGSYYVGDEFEVLEEKAVGNDIWVRTGFKQWGAMRYQGTQFMEYI